MNKQEHWTAVVFLSECLLFHIDNLEGSPLYKHKLKHHLKQALQEVEKIQEVVWASFKQEAQKTPHLMEMNYAVSQAYPKLMQIFKTTPAWQMPYIIQTIEYMQKEDKFKEMQLFVKEIDQ